MLLPIGLVKSPKFYEYLFTTAGVVSLLGAYIWLRGFYSKRLRLLAFLYLSYTLADLFIVIRFMSLIMF